MLRHSSPRQVRKNRREATLRARIADWDRVIAKHGDCGIRVAIDCGVNVSPSGSFISTDHLPGVPKDLIQRLVKAQEAAK